MRIGKHNARHGLTTRCAVRHERGLFSGSNSRMDHRVWHHRVYRHGRDPGGEMNRKLAIYEAKQLARQVNDNVAVANFINKCHGTSWKASDIAKIRMDLDPRQSVPRNMAGVRVVVGEALPLTPPLTTLNDNTIDPLLQALAAYHAKRSNGDLRAYWERLAA